MFHGAIEPSGFPIDLSSGALKCDPAQPDTSRGFP